MTAADNLASAVDAIVRADPPDLDRVIDRLAGVLAPEELLAACRLLHDRVVSAAPSHLDVIGYLDNVVRLSDAAAERAEPESAQHKTARWEATLARWARHLRTRNRADLPDLDRLSGRSVRAFAPDSDEQAAAMLLRALVLAEFGRGGAAVWSALHGAFQGRFRPGDGRVGYARWAGPFATARFRAALDPGLLVAMQPRPRGGHGLHGQPVIMAVFAAYQRGDRDMSPMRSIAMFLEALQTEQNTPESRANLLGMLAGLYLIAALSGDADGIAEAVDLLTEGKRLVGPRSRMSAEFDEFQALAVAIRLMSHGDLDDVAASTDRMGGGDISYRAVNRMTRANLQIHHAVRTGDLSMLDQATAELQVYVDQRTVGDPDRVTALGVMAEAERARLAISGESRAYRQQELREQLLRETDAGATPALRGYALVSAGALLHDSAIAARDLRQLAEAIGTLAEALDTLPADSPLRAPTHILLGTVRWTRAGLLHDGVEAHRAVQGFEVALQDIPHVSDTLWTAAQFGLGHALRIRGHRGDDRRSLEAGRHAMRGHAWQVLVQSGSPNAAVAAREAAASAVEVAAWSVADGRPDDAAFVLDSGRALVLHAAAVAVDVPAQLAGLGHTELAAEWRRHAAGAVAPELPTNLRVRAFRALLEAAPGSTARLLDPLEIPAVKSALATANVDALIYLVPPTPYSAAVAVAVPAIGPAASIPLPSLVDGLDPPDPVGGSSRGDRDLAPMEALATRLQRPFPDPAWSAAVDRILAFCAERRLVEPRLVLTPMGALGLVPWHAVRNSAGRYLLEEAVVSYAASARLFCTVSARAPVPPGSASLVVGDPTGDLRYAGREAAAIRDSLYPSARYLGRRHPGVSDGPGTSGELMAWLEQARQAPLGLLHLATHGVVEPRRPRSSYLTLADGNLSAEELLAQAQTAEQQYNLGLVVLAACSTVVSGHGYDEAFSLSTAFLVAGARSVIGSLWPVPDESTSLLMFMFHHYLRQDSPAHALRRAQLWMLDDNRTAPADMPPALAERAPAIAPDDLLSWAGFSHLGQ